MVQESLHDQGALIAAITRNRYGALVLNSANVLFTYIDLPEQFGTYRVGLFSRLRSIFDRSSETVDPEEELRTIYRLRFVEFHNQHPHLTLRVYETYAGFRIIIMNQLLEPLHEETRALLEKMNSDTL